MKKTISSMAALIVAANALLLTGGVSAQSLRGNDCIFYSGYDYVDFSGEPRMDNDWNFSSGLDIHSVRVRNGCAVTYQVFSKIDGEVFRGNSTSFDNPNFFIPLRYQTARESTRVYCVCQDHCIDTTVEYGQEKNTNQGSSNTTCLGVGQVISIPNLGETTFDNNLGFVTIKAGRWYNNIKGLKPPRYEIRAYQHPGGTGSLLHSHKMQGQNVLSSNGRTWWTSDDVKFSASSLYIERTF